MDLKTKSSQNTYKYCRVALIGYSNLIKLNFAKIICVINSQNLSFRVFLFIDIIEAVVSDFKQVYMQFLTANYFDNPNSSNIFQLTILRIKTDMYAFPMQTVTLNASFRPIV